MKVAKEAKSFWESVDWTAAFSTDTTVVHYCIPGTKSHFSVFIAKGFIIMHDKTNIGPQNIMRKAENSACFGLRTMTKLQSIEAYSNDTNFIAASERRWLLINSGYKSESILDIKSCIMK